MRQASTIGRPLTQLLHQSSTLFLDCQTSGSRPETSQIIEIGWSLGLPFSELTVHSRITALPDGFKLSKAITQLTGITEDDVNSGASCAHVWQVEMGINRQSLPCVIHYARFEIPFITPWLELIGSQLDIICTYEISRRLFPDLPSRSLRALAGFLGYPITNLKRSAHHVEATIFIWRELVKILTEQEGLKTFSDLRQWLEETPPPKAGRKKFGLEADIRLNLPDQPGVYQMLDQKGSILYIGKATSLKSRVNSYFRGRQTKGSRLNEMIAQVKDIHVIPCIHPIEAALRETDLIKQFDPPYNRALKKGARDIWWLTNELTSSTRFQDARWGPFGSANILDVLQEVWAIVRGDVLPAISWAEVDDTVMNEGLHLFLTKYPGSYHHPNFLAHIALLCWRQRLQESAEVVAEDTEELNPEDMENAITAESICRYFEHIFAGIVRRAHRGRWLTWIMESVILWKSPSDAVWYQITLERGQPFWHTLTRKPRRFPVPAHFCEPLHERRSHYDLMTYDRLNILLTEIYKLIKGGAVVRIVLGPHRILDESAIRQVIFPGGFHDNG